MKKIFITSYSLTVGGIETALINLLKYLDSKDYDITLALEKKEGPFLKDVPERVHIVENYQPKIGGNPLIRKFKNFIKQKKFDAEYKNKYDFSISFATYSFPGSYAARVASKNCALWVHLNYMDFFGNDLKSYKDFFKNLHAEEFSKIVFVSNYDRLVFNSSIPELSKKTITCNNLIDGDLILEKSKATVSDLKEANIPTFINIGRHDERQKKLSRIIKATKKLFDEGYKFRLVFIGDGDYHGKYMDMTRGMQNVLFLGSKKNPYPYLKMSDALIMSSEYEGFPVVWVEAKILNKMIITTKVSDWKTAIEDTSSGFVTEISDDGVYEGMKKFLDTMKDAGKCEPSTFDVNKFNDEIKEKLISIIEE